MTDRSAIIVFSHGSKDPGWARPIERVQAVVRRLLPDTAVELAFLERMNPTLEQAVSKLAHAGANRITIVPLFLAAGGHIKDDLAALISRLQIAHPRVRLTATGPLGEDEEMVDSIANWVARKHRGQAQGER